MKLRIASAEKYLLNLGLGVEYISEGTAKEIVVRGTQRSRSEFVRNSISKMREFGWELADLMNLGSTWRAIFEPASKG
jgi:hypothetical protein